MASVLNVAMRTSSLSVLLLVASSPLYAELDLLIEEDIDYGRGHERYERDIPHREVPFASPSALGLPEPEQAAEPDQPANPSAPDEPDEPDEPEHSGLSLDALSEEEALDSEAVVEADASQATATADEHAVSFHDGDEPSIADGVQASDDPAQALAEADDEPAGWGPIHLLGSTVVPGERKRLTWTASESFAGTSISTPVIVIHGEKEGPVLCLTAAVHGDELNGVEVVRRIIYSVSPAQLSGTIVGVPIVNLFGFSRGSRYLPDRRDLNRFFPGNPNGSAASRIAFSFFQEVSSVCDMLVDFHTGSFDRTNLPQLRADLSNEAVLEFTRNFGATAVLHTAGERGMLRRALTDRSKPAVTFEIGAPLRLEPEEIEQGVSAIETLMQRLGMVASSRRQRSAPQPVYYESRWVRADMGGMLFSEIKLGDQVRTGQRLGRVVDPLTNAYSEIVSPVRGRVLGMALNQVVLPGYASYHIGVAAPEEQLVRDLDDDSYEPVPEHDRLDDGSGPPLDEYEDERAAPRDPSDDLLPEEEPDPPVD